MSIKNNGAKSFLESLMKGTPSFGKMLQSLRECDDISQVELASKLAKIMNYPQASFLSILLEEQMKKAKLHFKVTLDKTA